MQRALIGGGILLAALAAQPASACTTPPPPYVHPTEHQLLERFVTNATDIVYGVITRSGERGQPSRFKVLHVYRGSRKKGDVIDAPLGWGHPEPFCAGMVGPPHPKPVGTYGVIAFQDTSPQLGFIRPSDVQTMIKERWIRSARAR